MTQFERGYYLGLMTAAGLALLSLLVTGCAGGVSLGGPNGLHVTGSLMGASGYDAEHSRAVASTWGNGSIDMGAKKSKIERRGVSDNLRGVIGDGFGIALADSALCAFVPTSCVFDRFTGSDQERDAIEAQMRATEGE